MAPKQPVPVPMPVIEYLSGSITRHDVPAGEPSHTITQDLRNSLLLKGQHETRKTVEVHVKHDRITAPMPNVVVTHVVDSFDNAKIDLSTICDITLREKLKEPTLQLHAKSEAPILTADEVRMSQLAEISPYCRHHDITAEKWSHIYAQTSLPGQWRP